MLKCEDKHMIARRRWLKGVGGLLTVSVLGFSLKPGGLLAADLADDTKRFVQAMADDMIVKLTDKGISRTERKERMHGFMQKYFFISGIAQWVLGRFWRKASESERAEFITLFKDLLIETYVDRFAEYNGVTLKIIKADVRGEKDVIVSSSLKHQAGTRDIKLDWRVRSLNGEYKIIDIVVEGVSMGQTQRAQFAAAIKNSANDMEKFLIDFRERVSVVASGS